MIRSRRFRLSPPVMVLAGVALGGYVLAGPATVEGPAAAGDRGTESGRIAEVRDAGPLVTGDQRHETQPIQQEAFRTVEIAPGTIVRWLAPERSGEAGEPGEAVEVTRCGAEGKSWRPQNGACWYAIDLLRKAGSLDLVRYLSERGERGEVEERRPVEVSGYIYPVQHITLENDSQVHLSSQDLARVRRDQSRVGALWARTTTRRFTFPLGLPLENLPAGGRFGSRRFFNGEPRSPHSGADYAAVEGTSVLSAAPGEIVLSDDLFFSGESVFVDHGDGLITMYFHLSERLVHDGEVVETGQPVGSVGATGRATGPHLHFGIRWRGARVDPSLLLGVGSDVQTIR